MPRPNGPQWRRLYRGLSNVVPEEVDRSQVGSHWTPDFNVAYNFALSKDVDGYPHDWNPDDEVQHGTVVEALVHPRHIIDPESEEGRGWRDFEAVFGREHPEQERTVRPGAPVHIQFLHHFDENDNQRELALKKGSRSRA